MKRIIIGLCCCYISQHAFAQDTLYIKGGEKLAISKLKIRHGQYHFLYNNHADKGAIIQTLIDSVYVSNKKEKKTIQENIDTSSTMKAWQLSSYLSIGLGNNITINNPSGLPNSTSLSMDIGIDFNANYLPEKRRFAVTNELHYLFGVQKQGLATGNPLQISQDRLNTLHDVSWKIGQTSAWNLNAIFNTSSPLITQFSGQTFKDYSGFGRISGLLSPYELRIAPGIKFQPNTSIRFSVSPYSVQLRGVQMKDVAAKGIYITDTLASGKYKTFVAERLGAEINVWYDKQIGEWLQLQYRASISANYFEQIARNGMLDLLCITRIKLIKDLYLTHRITLQNTFSNRFFKPFLNQNMLLSYSKSF